MVFVRVGEILTNRRHVFANSKRVVDALLVINTWEAVLRDTNCVEKFSRTKVLNFKNGVLTIVAGSSTVAAELKICEAKILQAYAKRFKASVVQKLLIRRG